MKKRQIITAISLFFLLCGCSTTTDSPKLLPVDEETRYRATQIAMKYLGMPYAWGGQSWWTDAQGTVDCSGLVINVYKEAVAATDGTLPFDDATAASLASDYTVPLRTPETGDLIFMGDDGDAITHVAICLSVEQDILSFIDAYSVDGKVEKRSYLITNPKIRCFGRMVYEP